MSPELKRHLVSGAITFVAGFLLFVGSELQSFTVDTLTTSAVAGLVMAGARAGIKVAFEMFFLSK